MCSEKSCVKRLKCNENDIDVVAVPTGKHHYTRLGGQAGGLCRGNRKSQRACCSFCTISTIKTMIIVVVSFLSTLVVVVVVFCSFPLCVSRREWCLHEVSQKYKFMHTHPRQIQLSDHFQPHLRWCTYYIINIFSSVRARRVCPMSAA